MKLTIFASLGLLALSASVQAQSAPTAQRPPAPAVQVRGLGPNGATLRCRDGSYPAPGAADAACAERGGVLVRFPLERRPVPAARSTASSERVERAVPATSGVAAQARADSLARGGRPSWQQQRSATQAPPRPPAGARLLCGDGSYVVGDTASARCASRGGVKLRINQPPTTRLRARGN